MKVQVKSLNPKFDRILSETISVCPECLERVSAQYVTRNDIVYLKKACPHHGEFSVKVWTGARDFVEWLGSEDNSLPDIRSGKDLAGCPGDCGGCDAHRQETCCVLLEVTSRCNLSCPVCFASSGAQDAEDPSLSTIAGWYDMLMANGGPFNIQLSGGEPTMRDDLPEIIRLGKERGFSFFQLNTNGLRIASQPDYLKEIADAGLNTVFLQFDGLSEASGLALRGADLLEAKKRAIEVCGEIGVGVVLVPTVARGVNDAELGAVLRFAADNMPSVRGVHFQPVSFFGRCELQAMNAARITIPELLGSIESQMDGLLHKADFRPSNTEHPLCGFHATYTVSGGKWTLQKSENSSCCIPSSKARTIVARKWSAARPASSPSGSKYGTQSLDEFLVMRQEKTLALSGMAFQDAWTMDLKRLQRCYIGEVSPQGQLIPFCAYNLSAADGSTLYRGRTDRP